MVLYEDGEAQWISDLGVFEISCSDFQFQFIYLRGYAYDTDHTKISNPDIKQQLINTHTHRMPFLHSWCGGFNGMWLHGSNV